MSRIITHYFQLLVLEIYSELFRNILLECYHIYGLIISLNLHPNQATPISLDLIILHTNKNKLLNGDTIMRIVLALGGNALLARGQALTAENQRDNISKKRQPVLRQLPTITRW